MDPAVFVYDPTVEDEQSKVRGVGRYLQILKEAFPGFSYTSDLSRIKELSSESIFIHPFINFLQPPIVKKRLAAKQIAVIHDLIPLKYPSHFPAGIKGRLNILANKNALKQYDIIVTDSEASKKDIQEKLTINSEKVKVIYPCLPKIFTKESRIKNKEPRIYSEFLIPNSKFCVYVGDATWNKNLVNIAKAIKQADVNCIFVGKVFLQRTAAVRVHPWQKELMEFFQLVKGDPRFVFPGFVSDEELLQLYRSARVNLLVSRDEGFGYSFFEAGSQKTPSLLSDISVFHETAQDTAVFVNPENHEEIAAGIKKFFAQEELQQTLGDEAFLRARLFTAPRFRSQLQLLLVGGQKIIPNQGNNLLKK